VLIVVVLAFSGILLVAWAMDPGQWTNALAFRGFVLLANVPFIMMATAESVRRRRHSEMWVRPDLTDRLPTIRMVAVIFLVVLTTQGIVWHRLTGTLRAALISSPVGCLTVSALPWLGRTPLDHWATPSYAILLQGRSPRTLVLAGDGCADLHRGGEILVAPGDGRTRKGGWFDLRGAER
jgi:hypothetical protein